MLSGRDCVGCSRVGTAPVDAKVFNTKHMVLVGFCWVVDGA